MRQKIYTIVDKVAIHSTPLFLASSDEHATREFRRFLEPRGDQQIPISEFDFDLKCVGEWIPPTAVEVGRITCSEHDYPYHVCNGGEVMLPQKVDGNCE
ncbi:hypothetical protein [Tortoise microvirus 28]|nr:hypothetical protein [Tortoise microvirus 28]